ncbi:MAG TPA: flagellar hook assembly protein FlgD [Hyphomicrobiaceae bacterium]|jgi:flagellar basal-body rod modification protein FlgD
MQVSPTQAAGPSTAAQSAQAPQTVDYQAFLRLLIEQMKNQDPTNPMDSTDYMAQLASFSQVEQAVRTNAKLDQLLQSSTLSQAGNLIGREITSSDGEITGKVAEVRLVEDGLVAILETGEEVAVGPGIVIR